MRPGNVIRRALLGTIVVFGLALAGCSTHRIAIQNPCPAVTSHGIVIHAPYRGGIGLAKIGLTPAAVKAQEKCG